MHPMTKLIGVIVAIAELFSTSKYFNENPGDIAPLHSQALPTPGLSRPVQPLVYLRLTQFGGRV
jgi:hypothetical protein